MPVLLNSNGDLVKSIRGCNFQIWGFELQSAPSTSVCGSVLRGGSREYVLWNVLKLKARGYLTVHQFFGG